MTFKVKRYVEPSGDDVVGTVAELFAGVGGFRVGLARSGWKTTFSNQWEPSTKSQHASDCYVFNFGSEGHTNEDITELVERHVKSESALIPKTDLLVGGFPCQDYSVAKSLNSSKGLEGKKGVLWWSIRALVEKNRPHYVFLENVDRLLKSPATQRGRDFAIMLNTLGGLGYLIEWRIVNAAEYGFPQRRIRVFIVASKTSRNKVLTESEAAEIIGSRGVLARSLPIKPLQAGIETIDVSSTFSRGATKSPFQSSGVCLGGKAYTVKTESKYSGKKYVLADVLADDEQVGPEYWVPGDRISEWEYLKGAKSIERTHKESGATYSYAEGKMAFPDLLTNPSRTILTGEGGTSASRFKHIIRQGNRYRRLTPLELERLNGFPDQWTQNTQKGELGDARRAFFMGNALVVGLVERVGAVLAADLKARKDS